MSKPRRDIGRAYLNALDRPPKPKPEPEEVGDATSEPDVLPGEGPRQNGVSYGTRSEIRRLLAEAEEQVKSEQRARPRPRRRQSWRAIVLASAVSCALGFLLGRLEHEPAVAPVATSVTIPPGHYYCARCQTTHPKPAYAIGNPRTWCPKLTSFAAPPPAASTSAAPAIPEKVRRLRSSAR